MVYCFGFENQRRRVPVAKGSNPLLSSKYMEGWQSLAYCSGLENRRGLIAPRGFESHTFRQINGRLAERSKAAPC